MLFGGLDGCIVGWPGLMNGDICAPPGPMGMVGATDGDGG